MTSSLLHSKLDDPAEIRSGLETIFVSGNHLLTLINNIIDLSKIRSGKMLLEEDSTDIPSTIKEAIDACRSLSEEKKIKICSFYEETLPRFVVCDSLKVRQILINLIGNAIKFSRPGEQITVSVTLDRDEKRTSVPFKPSDDNPSESSRIHILFTVTDSGPGIRKELLHNVFGSFVQLDRSHETMVRYGSSGLGLHISRELASIMNGTIWIQSSILDVGSTFAFSIPVIPCDNGASSVTRTQNHVTELEPALDRIRKKYFNYKVLIVEDNLINQKVIFKLLSRFGFSLEVANNGKDALKMIEDAQFQNDGFDLVMMDVQMPVMDGLTASKTIVEKFGNSRPKICALTANVMKQEMATCLKSGMDYYLSKPVTVSKLYNFFISVLEDPEIVIELSPTPNLPNPHLRSLDSPSPRPKNPSSSTSE